MVVAYGILCIIFTLTVTGDGMVKLWNIVVEHEFCSSANGRLGSPPSG